MAVARVNINDPQNYKPCCKKQYEIWMCKPPVGTVVINKLEQAGVAKQLGGRTAFSIEALRKMQRESPQLFAQLEQLVRVGQVYCVKDNDVVLCGTRGEFWVTSVSKVQSTYQVRFQGQWGSNWAGATKERAKVVDNQFLIPWMKVHALGGKAGQLMACHVPLGQTGTIQTSWSVLKFNDVGVEHGNGDFIICTIGSNGIPNMGDRWVVNGAVFADTYNHQGWQSHLSGGRTMVSAQEPAPLF